MAKTESKLPVTKEQQEMMRPWMPHAWHPLEGLRREVDRLFQSFDRDFKISSFPRMTQDFSSAMPDMGWMLGAGPAVDFAETDKGYEITMELPGLDEKSIEVKLSNGGLIVKGEKRVEKEEKTRTTSSTSAITAPSSAHSACQMASTSRKLMRRSRTAY